MHRSAVRACLLAAGLMVLSAPATAWAQDTTPTDPPTTADVSTPLPTTVPDTTTLEQPTTDAPDPVEVAPSDATLPEEAPDDVGTEAVTASAAADPPTSSVSRPAVDQQVTITITSPTDGAQVAPGAPVEVTGTVTIGLLGAGVSIVYVVDTSGSTDDFVGDCNGDGVEDTADDANNDGSPGEIIDCEIFGVLTLEDQLAGINGSIETGLVQFNRDFQVETGFGAPGRSALETAVTALEPGGGTDFDAALEGMNELFGQAASGNRKIGYLFTDGRDSGWSPGSELQAAIDAGIVVNTFSVGPGSVGCGADSPLTIIANATGGQCIQVDDPTDLIKVLAGLRPAGIEKVEVSVNGGPPIEAAVDLLGNFKVTVTGIIVGANKIVATATTTDGQTASDDVTVNAGVTPDSASTGPTPLRVAAAVATSPRFTG